MHAFDRWRRDLLPEMNATRANIHHRVRRDLNLLKSSSLDRSTSTRAIWRMHLCALRLSGI